MSLEVYYRQDIINAIRAAEQATIAACPNDARYLEGYKAALLTIALAFGLISDNDSQAGLPRLADDRPALSAMFLTMH